MTSNAVAIGAAVRTTDGRELGKVKELSGSCFKVDAPMQPDYWLAADAVSSSAPDGAINLRFSRDELSGEKQDGPAASEHAGFHRHT